jgi:hypothetical protein
LALLGRQGGAAAVQLVPLALEFGQGDDLGQVGIEQPLLLAVHLAHGLADARVAVPVAGQLTRGAFLGAWRLMSIDGFEWDVPDTPGNAAAFGYGPPRYHAAPGASAWVK